MRTPDNWNTAQNSKLLATIELRGVLGAVVREFLAREITFLIASVQTGAIRIHLQNATISSPDVGDFFLDVSDGPIWIPIGPTVSYITLEAWGSVGINRASVHLVGP